MVGSHARAVSISRLLKPLNGHMEVFKYESKRSFITFTGCSSHIRMHIFRVTTFALYLLSQDR